MWSSNSSNVTKPSLLISILLKILSKNASSISIPYFWNSPTFPLAKQALISLASIVPSPLISRISKAYLRYCLFRTLVRSEAAVKNSSKLIFPSLSVSHFLRTFFQFTSLPKSDFYVLVNSLIMLSISSGYRKPSWLTSILVKIFLSAAMSSLSDFNLTRNVITLL